MSAIAVIPDGAQPAQTNDKTEKKAVAKTTSRKETPTMDKKASDVRKRNLDLAISQIKKDFGETAILQEGGS